MRVLISLKEGNTYYFNGDGDFHCKEGVVKKEEFEGLKNSGGIVKTHTDRKLLCFMANSYDKSKKIKRGPQIVTPKDLGYIAARSGIGKDSIIVEAGGGSGGATLFFSRICKEVRTYEIRKDYCDIVNKNIEVNNCSNIKVVNLDLGEKIHREKNFDMLFLDMPNPQIILEKNLSGLKSGHYVVCYVPSVTQIIDIANSVECREDLYLEEISEVVLRNWKVSGRIARPNFRKEIDHTAFLVFIRKI